MTLNSALPANDRGPDTGGRRPTINDIARLAGVSKKTVSRVINESPAVETKTRARIRAIIEQTGYVPDPQARALASGGSCTVALIYDALMAPSMMLMPFGMLDVLKGSGFEMVIYPTSLNSPRLIEDLRAFIRRQRLFGIMLAPPVSDDMRIVDLLEELGCDYVRISSSRSGAASGRVVDANDKMGGWMAAQHLASLGHTNLAFLAGPGGDASSERLEGFRLGLAQKGVELADENIMQGGFGFEGGWAAGDELLARKMRPTAIFCDTDEMAAGVLRACQLAGVDVPGELSIMGYGDFRVAPATWPPLTTVKSTTRDIGRLAMERLLGGGQAQTDTPMPSLVVRGSTAPPAH